MAFGSYTAMKFIYNRLGGRKAIIKALEFETITDALRIKLVLAKVLSMALNMEVKPDDSMFLDLLDIFFMNENMKVEYMKMFNDLEGFK